MPTEVEPRTWRQFGFGGPPQPWSPDELLDLDRLATTYYLEVLDARRALIGANTRLRAEAEELASQATGHKVEIDFSLRHPATPAEQARVEDRLAALIQIGRRMRALSGG